MKEKKREEEKEIEVRERKKESYRETHRQRDKEETSNTPGCSSQTAAVVRSLGLVVAAAESVPRHHSSAVPLSSVTEKVRNTS